MFTSVDGGRNWFEVKAWDEATEEREVAHAALTLTVARMSVYLAHLWEYTLAEAPEGVEPPAPTEEFIELAHEAAAMYEQEKEQLSDE